MAESWETQPLTSGTGVAGRAIRRSDVVADEKRGSTRAGLAVRVDESNDSAIRRWTAAYNLALGGCAGSRLRGIDVAPARRFGARRGWLGLTDGSSHRLLRILAVAELRDLAEARTL